MVFRRLIPPQVGIGVVPSSLHVAGAESSKGKTGVSSLWTSAHESYITQIQRLVPCVSCLQQKLNGTSGGGNTGSFHNANWGKLCKSRPTVFQAHP